MLLNPFLTLTPLHSWRKTKDRNWTKSERSLLRRGENRLKMLKGRRWKWLPNSRHHSRKTSKQTNSRKRIHSLHHQDRRITSFFLLRSLAWEKDLHRLKARKRRKTNCMCRNRQQEGMLSILPRTKMTTGMPHLPTPILQFPRSLRRCQRRGLTTVHSQDWSQIEASNSRRDPGIHLILVLTPSTQLIPLMMNSISTRSRLNLIRSTTTVSQPLT